MALETSGIDRYDKMPLLINRWLTQIHLVAPECPSKVAKAWRCRPRSNRLTTPYPLPTPPGGRSWYYYPPETPDRSWLTAPRLSECRQTFWSERMDLSKPPVLKPDVAFYHIYISIPGEIKWYNIRKDRNSRSSLKFQVTVSRVAKS